MSAAREPRPPLTAPVRCPVGTELPALLALLVAGLLATGLLTAGPAFAHTELRASSPRADAVLPATTSQVVLSFTGRVRSDLSTVVLTGPDGDDHARGPVTVRGNDLVQGVDAPLPAGRWRLLYRVVAADGHPITGAVPFTVADTASSVPEPSGAPVGGPAPSPAPGPAPTAEREASGSSSGGAPGPPLVAAGGLLAVGAGLLVHRWRRARVLRADASAGPADPS